ncbi:MAG: hypothetical protein CVT60_03725 [Actinobacteria bacterium HGW-Actinobacteria-10]|jgi:hypothetical protein|nr:MAG: hypothetical protein CVT60_03725 [Actinobacteria bacterium HGW-Actinobacteria-10]
MSSDDTALVEPRLTIDDVRHHAQEVRDLAMEQVKRVKEIDTTRAVVIGAVVVVGLIGLAYLAGARSNRAL